MSISPQRRVFLLTVKYKVQASNVPSAVPVLQVRSMAGYMDDMALA